MNEPRGQRDKIVVWRVSDGRAGHDTQSRGLSQALAAIKDCECHELCAQSLSKNLMNILRHRFPAGDPLPDPDFIIGAGHGTHMTLLAAGRARGGKTVVLMKPSLPALLFDYCLVPGHDQPSQRQNILVTRGVLNCAVPAAGKAPDQGVILIGGASRHYGWDAHGLLRQIREICAGSRGTHWLIADSPRTPSGTRPSLSEATPGEWEYIPHETTGPGWMAQRLACAATAWVTEDSISMICEALTAGAAVGVLSVPVKRRGRVTRAVDDLVKAGLITRFSAWQRGTPLRPADPPIYEAARCARLLLERTGRL